MIVIIVFLVSVALLLVQGRNAQTLALAVARPKLMMTFIVILGLHVGVIGGMCIYQRLAHH